MVEVTKTKEHGNGSTAIAICIGFLPLLMALTPLSFSPVLEEWQKFVVFHSLIVPVIQFVIVLIVMWEGGSVFRGWLGLPLISRLSVALWLPLTLYTAFLPGNDYLSSAIATVHIFSILLFALSLFDRNSYSSPDLLIKIWSALVLGLLAYFFVFVIYIITNYSEKFLWIGPYPGFINIRHVSFLGMILFGAALHNIIIEGNRKSISGMAIFLLLSAVSGLVVVFWTGSRGPTLATLFFIFTCLILIPKKRKLIAVFSFSAVLLALIVASLLPLPNDPMLGVHAAFGLTDVSSESVDAASSGRIQIWLATINLVAEKPILGWGLGQYLKFNPFGYGELAHPHNSVVQILFVSGISGLLFSFFIVLPIVYSKFDFRNSISNRFHISMISTLTLYSLYDGILYFSFPILIFVLSFMGCLKQPAPDRSG